MGTVNGLGDGIHRHVKVDVESIGHRIDVGSAPSGDGWDEMVRLSQSVNLNRGLRTSNRSHRCAKPTGDSERLKELAEPTDRHSGFRSVRRNIRVRGVELRIVHTMEMPRTHENDGWQVRCCHVAVTVDRCRGHQPEDKEREASTTQRTLPESFTTAYPWPVGFLHNEWPMNRTLRSGCRTCTRLAQVYHPLGRPACDFKSHRGVWACRSEGPVARCEVRLRRIRG